MLTRAATACIIYDELVLLQQAANATSLARRGAVSASPRPATGPLPWLLYSPGSSYLEATDVAAT